MSNLAVVDASFVFKLALPGAHQARFQAQAAKWHQNETELYAPTLWLYEMTSAWCKMAHFGELSLPEAQRMLGLVLAFDIQLITPDEALARAAFEWAVRLNRAAAYDSFYLALAEGLNCELWTADLRLHNTVDASWVRIVEA